MISGQQLPKVNQKERSIADPLVRVELYGVPQDQAKDETSYIINNGETIVSSASNDQTKLKQKYGLTHSSAAPSPLGFNPVWNETLNFDVHTPELALVRFVVEDYDKASRNDFLGQFTLPFTCIQAGELAAER